MCKHKKLFGSIKNRFFQTSTGVELVKWNMYDAQASIRNLFGRN